MEFEKIPLPFTSTLKFPFPEKAVPVGAKETNATPGSEEVDELPCTRVIATATFVIWSQPSTLPNVIGMIDTTLTLMNSAGLAPAGKPSHVIPASLLQ